MVLDVSLRERELPTARPIAVLFDIAAATFFRGGEQIAERRCVNVQ
jgi:hypothetical protein